ncbi:MAG: radical SAM protein [candidate division WOR-3 bacterium]
MSNRIKALLVNPWVYDFKAFDFWNKPLGLLIVARMLKEMGFQVTLLDCMDRKSIYFKTTAATDQYGRGKYDFVNVDKPGIYKNVPRLYKRYGMPQAIFKRAVQQTGPPDIILVTSSMTYWYPGVFAAIRILKEVFPHAPVILGGIYASLCADHARERSGADHVLAGPAEDRLPELLKRLGYIQTIDLDTKQITPDFSFYPDLHYGVVLTSRGCPFDCTYCATQMLCPQFSPVPKSTVITQLSYLATRTNNIAFFDDALLLNKDLPGLLDNITERTLGLNFHTSNGLHCRFLDEWITRKMYRANFKTMYLSLETTDPDIQERTGGKVDTDEFIRAVHTLKKTGFPADAIHAYILYGMPGQASEETIASIRLCRELSIHPHLCEFSPIPYTKEYEKTGFTEKTDPLYHNNLFYTWYYPEPKPALYRQIKSLLT